MCGRYAMRTEVSDLKSAIEEAGLPLDDVKNADKIQPSLNIAPRSYSMVYCSPSKDKHVLEAMQWTLQPSYAREPVKFPTFNTRGESLSPLKPAWRSAKTRRGILIIDGYYEWRHLGKERLPFYMTSTAENLLLVLTVWDTNSHFCDSPTYSVVTTQAAHDLAHIHPRMPVVTSWEGARRWVDGAWPDVLDLVRPREGLNSFRVSKDVNKVGIDNPGLNAPLEKDDSKEKVDEVKTERPVTDWFAPAVGTKRSCSTNRGAKRHKEN